MRVCGVCNKEKPDGNRYFGTTCKGCYMRFWRKQNPAANRAIESRRKKTPAERSKEWREKNPERFRQLKAETYRRTKPAFIARNRARKAVAKQATPSWLSDADKARIVEIYASCPSDHHVDHIVPLRGKQVCGLHVPWNLRHLPAKENLKKGNRS